MSLLEFARQQIANHREELVACFVALARGEIAAPYETLGFCMHTLQFPEVIGALKERRDSASSSSRSHYDFSKYLADVRDSYAETWRDADLWEYYRDDKSTQQGACT